MYVWHGPPKNQLVFLCGELQLNYVAKWDLGSIVPGLLFPTAEDKKNLIYGSQMMYFVKKQSVQTFCTLSKINTEHCILIFLDKILHCYYLAEVYFVLLPSKIVKISIITITIYKYFSISLDKIISFWEPSIWDKCTDYNLNVNYKQSCRHTKANIYTMFDTDINGRIEHHHKSNQWPSSNV